MLSLREAVRKKLTKLEELETKLTEIAHSNSPIRKPNESLDKFLSREREGATYKSQAAFAIGTPFDPSPIQRTKEKLESGRKISQIYAICCPHFGEQVIINNYKNYLQRVKYL